MGDLAFLREVIQSYPALAIIILAVWVWRIRKGFIISVKSLKKSHKEEMRELTIHLEKEVEKMQLLTDRGIDSGTLSRKELRIDITNLFLDMAKVESFLMNKESYTKKKIGENGAH